MGSINIVGAGNTSGQKFKSFRKRMTAINTSGALTNVYSLTGPGVLDMAMFHSDNLKIRTTKLFFISHL